MQALEDVAVGREVAGVGDDGRPFGPRREHGACELVEVDGHRVGDEHLARHVLRGRVRRAGRRPRQGGSIHSCQPRTSAVDHSSTAPPSSSRVRREPAQGVAVHVERPSVLEDELVPEPAERVGGVPRLGVLSRLGVHSCGRRLPERRERVRPVAECGAHREGGALPEPADRGGRHRVQPLLHLSSGLMATRTPSSSFRRWCSPRLPIRQGVHFWHDSSAKKRMVSPRRRSGE